MANALSIQTLVDGPRNVVAKVTAVADTSDFSGSTVLDPATLSATNPPTNQLAVDEIQYSVEDGWQVELYWKATTPVLMVTLSGRGMFPVGPNYGGVPNNAGTGKDGKITISTIGYSSGTMVATLILHCHKQTA